MLDSIVEKTDGPVILFSQCKANVIFTEPKKKPHLVIIQRLSPTAITTPQKVLGVRQCQRIDEQPSARRRLDFDTPFYNKDYYALNSSSPSFSMSQKTFKPPKPRDQRWYSYNSPTVFSAMSLFSLTVDEKERVAQLNIYLDTRDARIAYQVHARKVSQGRSRSPTSSKLRDSNQNETGLLDVEDTLKQDTLLDSLEDDNHNPMSPSALDNIEISMVHVLPTEF
ncbi:UDP-glycosyltransferase 76F1-like [Pyrus ussuriensis x Pyrus communis]|uniref:UDP-glycosyltransferase 76F1-like n=1 Tax=Pyrus ussuriensis x Pyrus communis TaxID=2448454 RepID=A0A5N5HKM9_9ROSA|nr:UDP-glycosyltransferase 76F1-like [Pyrus ussuriensis x Pyrus communis]